MRRLRDIAEIVRRLRRRLRSGGKRRDSSAWISRLPHEFWEGSASLRALANAIAVRHVVSDAFPEIDCAVLRGFRQPAREPPERSLLARISREVPAAHHIAPW
jgi:hypothetical protein